MRIIRTALVLSTGFSFGAVYTLRHSTEIVDALGDLRDEVIKAFSEQEDPEPLKTLLEQPRFAEKDDDEILWATGDMDSEFRFTVGDLRALSVHYDPDVIDVELGGQYVKVDELSHTTMRALLRARSQLEDTPPDTRIVLEGEAPGSEPIITAVQLREVLTALNIIIINPDDETPKETTTT